MQSAPLLERLREMMNNSDNVMAECIGREVAAANGPAAKLRRRGRRGDRASSTPRRSTPAARTLMDSSGLSVDDRLTAETLDEVVQRRRGRRTSRSCGRCWTCCPSQAAAARCPNRFLDTDAGRAPAGWLRAKTGSLTGTNSLVGIVTDASGRVLTFALMSNNAGPTGRTAIDALAATLRSCGCGS